MSIVKIAQLPVTAEMLTSELNRRLGLGFVFDFGDERGIHQFCTAPADIMRWMQEVTPVAQVAMNIGKPERKISIKTETGLVDIAASEWWVILDRAATWRQPLYASYFALKAMSPIPTDYAINPAYWP